MKKIRFSIFTVFPTFLILCCSCRKQLSITPLKEKDADVSVSRSCDTTFRADYTYNLNVIYFVPNDLQLDSAYHKRASKYLLDGQEFYRSWMNHWGFGNKSFGLIKDTAHKLVKLSVITGKKPASGYSYSTSSADAIIAEVNEYFAVHPSDRTSRKYLIITYSTSHETVSAPFFGYGNFCFAVDYPGMDLDADAGRTTYVGGMMHELGHGLGLPHDGGLRSVNTQLGTSLMGTGNGTYGRSATYITKAGCATLNNCQVFNGPIRSDWYESVKDTIKHLHATYLNGNVVVSGTFANNSAASVNYLNFYNNPGNSGLLASGYKSSAWAAPVIGTDSFNISMPYSDFIVQQDTSIYSLYITGLHENGVSNYTKYNYKIENGVPVINIDF